MTNKNKVKLRYIKKNDPITLEAEYTLRFKDGLIAYDGNLG